MRLLAIFCLLFYSCSSYQSLHKNAIVVDTHNDVLSTATMKGLNIERDLQGKTHTDITRLKKSGIDAQIFAIFCDERFGKGTAFQFANREIDSLMAIITRNTNALKLATSPAELRAAIQQNKIACLMGVEGGHMIEDNLVYLDSFYKRGVRYMTLTWNNSTSWASSAADEVKEEASSLNQNLKSVIGNKAEPRSGKLKGVAGATLSSATADKATTGDKGLSSFGKKIINRMNQLGMLVDLSHVGEQTFWDALNTTSKPVLVSHSSVYALCPVFRNLKDEQIKAIAKNGGVIHVNFFSGFLDSNYARKTAAFMGRHQKEVDSLNALEWANYEVEDHLMAKHATEAAQLRPPLSLLLDHIDYIVKLAGVDHVGLGSDFDGIPSAPQQLNSVADMPLITKGLLQRGYNKADVKKILGENFMRVFRANQSN